MVRLLALLIALVGIVVLAQMFGLIDIDTRGQLKAPAIDVSVTGGALPEVDVDTAKVKVGTTTETVTLPTGIDVGTEPEQVKLPDVDVDEAPADGGSTAN